MSKNSKLLKGIPETENTFYLDTKGQITKQSYKGEFICKVMTGKGRALAAKHKAFLNGGLEESLPVTVLDLHAKLAYLKYALVSYPKFWAESDLGYDLYDIEVVSVVYDKVIEFEESWMTEIWGEDYVEELKGNGKSEE